MSKDLAVFQEDGTQALATASGGSTVEAEGKLVQRFVMELMTEKGSLLYLPYRGSSFVSSIKYGVASTSDIKGAFALALMDVAANLKSEESDTDDPAERYAGARLNGVILDGDEASLDITLASASGETNKLLLPLSFDL